MLQEHTTRVGVPELLSRGMLAVSAEAMDRNLLDRASAELGLAEQWRLAQAGA